jgi:hypothetical protein
MKDDDGAEPLTEPGAIGSVTRYLLDNPPLPQIGLRVDGHAQFAPWSEVLRSRKTSVDESPSIPVPSR